MRATTDRPTNYSQLDWISSLRPSYARSSGPATSGKTGSRSPMLRPSSPSVVPPFAQCNRGFGGCRRFRRSVAGRHRSGPLLKPVASNRREPWCHEPSGTSDRVRAERRRTRRTPGSRRTHRRLHPATSLLHESRVIPTRTGRVAICHTDCIGQGPIEEEARQERAGQGRSAAMTVAASATRWSFVQGGPSVARGP
jgi:hypothetical protein